MPDKPDVKTVNEFMEAAEDGPIVALFSVSQAEGAHPNGTRIVKAVCEEGDFTPVGKRGTVLGSTPAIDGEHGYFVKWDGLCVPVFVRGRKIEKEVSDGP